MTRSFLEWTDLVDDFLAEEFRTSRRSHAEHLEMMFSDYRCADRPGAGDLKRMKPTGQGVRKMHPPGLRIYGFCLKPGAAFVAVTGALEIETKRDGRVNTLKLREVRKFIRDNRLDDVVMRGNNYELFP